jgi:N4-gp56 family major capsid protein
MAITGTGQLGDSRIEVMSAEFDMIVPRNYVYSQAPLAEIPAGGVLADGAGFSSLRIPSYHRMLPANTTRSELTDISPVQLRDSQVTINPSLYGNAVQLSLKVQKEASKDVFQIAAQLVAENAAESVDYVARSIAIAGAAYEYGNGSSRDGITADGALTPGMLYNAAGYLASAPKLDGGLNQPTIGGGLAAIMRSAIIADLAENSSIILLGQYRDAAPETVLMGEVGAHMSGVRLVVSDYAKIFHGGGALVNVSSAEPLANAVTAGYTSMTVSSAFTSGGRGYVCVGTRETTANGEQTNVETIYMESSAANSTIAGGAPNGGFVYDHSSDTAISPANQVHAVVVMAAKSLMKIHDGAIGANPQLLPPKVDGLLDQWDSAQWRWFGGFGRWAENRLYRIEVGSNRQVLGI